MAQPAVPNRIADYIVLPVLLPPLPSFPQQATHYFYVRHHDSKQPSPSASRSLFIANIPIDANSILINHLLSEQLDLPAGRIEAVQFVDAHGHCSDVKNEKATLIEQHTSGQKRKRSTEDFASADIEVGLPRTWDRELHPPGTTVVVVFVDRPSRDAALRAIKSAVQRRQTITWGEGVRRSMPSLGLQRYLKHYELARPPRETLIQISNDYMTAYNERETAIARAAAQKRQVPDADGFVTVSRGGRMPAAKPEKAAQRLEKEKSRRKAFDDFYRFQFREQRKQKAVELIQKFEEDRAKVRKMRQQRGKFRPE